MKNVSNYLENVNNQKLYSMFKTKILWEENGAENIPSYTTPLTEKNSTFLTDWRIFESVSHPNYIVTHVQCTVITLLYLTISYYIITISYIHNTVYNSFFFNKFVRTSCASYVLGLFVHSLHSKYGTGTGNYSVFKILFLSGYRRKVSHVTLFLIRIINITANKTLSMDTVLEEDVSRSARYTSFSLVLSSFWAFSLSWTRSRGL